MLLFPGVFVRTPTLLQAGDTLTYFLLTNAVIGDDHGDVVAPMLVPPYSRLHVLCNGASILCIHTCRSFREDYSHANRLYSYGHHRLLSSL